MDLRESIKYNVDVIKAIDALNTKERQLFEQKVDEYNRMYDFPEALEYFIRLLASATSEYSRYFSPYRIECIGRLKSPISLVNKIIKYINSDEKHVPSPSGEFDFGISPIHDVFAMNLVLTDRPSSFHSKDPEINKLMTEKVETQAFIAEMQKFRSRLIDDEFSINPHFLYEVTKKEYYEKCIQILDRLISIIPTEATSLIATYMEQKESFREILDFIAETMPGEDTLVDETDYPTEDHNVDFIKLLDSLSARLYDKLDLATLTKQANSFFSNSELLERMGVNLVDFEEKRVESGYVANFMHLSTPYSTIECQLQSKNQYIDGNIGASAHSNMKNKKIKGVKIPNPENSEEVKRFRGEVLSISPRFYVAKMDDMEDGTVIVQEYTDYNNYRKVLGQVEKGSSQAKLLMSYFEKLYSMRHKIFTPSGNLMEFTDYDMSKYLREHSFTNRPNLEGPSL